ncbi:chorismate synthase [Rhodohalobacter barkolensis]|uniref:Chorismate synthase n=1 Tax=Rhodohalobacter barkolensis TaxID=2053187 RepID=A0A2N0VHJ8_9BACT|nr:chorismate synthase [Rhodohalobacter barkolensis]PKD43665.1 chorismate synthase [Rhodohalobacter barkolensis]
MFRYFTAGESHGPSLTGIVEGTPAGLELSEGFIEQHLVRRQKGYGRGGRMAFEKDKAIIQSGVRFGKTTGAPVAFSMVNRAFEKDDSNWPKVMAKEGERGDVEKITLPRPGHADLVGVQKYDFDDIRPVIERSSARETAMRVACCSVARAFLKELGIEIGGHVIQIGSIGYSDWDDVRAIADPLAENGSESIYKEADKSDVRCLNSDLSHQMREEIKHRRKEGTSLGGIYEIVVTGLPAGLGSYVHWDRKIDGQIAQAIVSTQAMKGVEIGLGFEAARSRGHEVHDEIVYKNHFSRRTNRAGGIEGGMTTGMPVIIRGAMKPIPTMIKPLKTADLETKKEQDTRYERSDVCALPRAVVVAESVIAPVLANAILEKFGGDSMNEIRTRFQNRTS